MIGSQIPWRVVFSKLQVKSMNREEDNVVWKYDSKGSLSLKAYFGAKLCHSFSAWDNFKPLDSI